MRFFDRCVFASIRVRSARAAGWRDSGSPLLQAAGPADELEVGEVDADGAPGPAPAPPPALPPALPPTLPPALVLVLGVETGVVVTTRGGVTADVTADVT
jgi:hypothetical protein